MKVSHTTPFGDMLSYEADLKEAVATLLDRCRSYFGKDADSNMAYGWLERRTAYSANAAGFVWIVGMRQPLRLSAIYQPTRLRLRRSMNDIRESDKISVPDLVKDSTNFVVTAGPGFGKTTFLHSLFMRLTKSETIVPFLFTLRQGEDIKALEELTEIIPVLRRRLKGKRLLILADGYDELTTELRRHISALLSQISAEKAANYILSCRDHYDIYMLSDAKRVEVVEFSKNDQLAFMRQYFLLCDRHDLDEAAVAKIHTDLVRRGFGDLLKHPLLLTLACITKADTPGFELRGSADLIEGALNALALRWDQQKGGSREATTPLKGPQRQTVLRKLAFAFEMDTVQEHRAAATTRTVLEQLGFSDIEPLDVLREIAQFYGIFVKVDHRWAFVHRPIRDYLAAQHSVRNGLFAQQVASDSFPLDSRTAYSAVLSDYATQALVKIFLRNDNIEVVRTVEEILLNEASFSVTKIWPEMVAFVERQQNSVFEDEREQANLKRELPGQFIKAAGSRCLQEIIRLGCEHPGAGADMLLHYGLVELIKRGERLKADAYHALLKHFANSKMPVELREYQSVRDLPHETESREGAKLNL